MGKGGCVDGHLVSGSYSSPVPLIGLYIAVATLVCFFCMTFDLVYGLFIRKKPFVPCKLFTMNAFTMTVLAIATKIPVDLTTPMPRAEDQISKLTSTALMCTSLGFYMPSLGTMGTSERYGNLAALSVMVITTVVNVCIQMNTGVIFALRKEHIIILICMLVLLLLMWSSAIAYRGQKEPLIPIFRSRISEDTGNNAKGVVGLRRLLVRLHVLNYTGNPQTLLSETPHQHAFGLLCALSSAVVLQAMLRLFAIKNMRSCGRGSSDYGWSIPMVIVAQFLTIAVGTFSIIYRWLSFVCHVSDNMVNFDPLRELSYLRVKLLSFGFLSKKFSKVFQAIIRFIINVLMGTQFGLCICSIILGIPFHIVKAILESIIPFDRCSHEDTQDIEEMSTSVSEIKDFVISSLHVNQFHDWICKMAMKDMKRWRNTCKKEPPTHLIQLISKYDATTSRSECADFIRKLEATGEDFVRSPELPRLEYEYRASFVSVLVLSKMLAELMPSSHVESLMHSLEALHELFEIINYIDQKTIDNPSVSDETRWTLGKELWVEWENPNHWFRTKMISPAFKSCSMKKSKESIENSHALEVLLKDMQSIQDILGDQLINYNSASSGSLDRKHKVFIAIEFSIICKFIREKEHEHIKSVKDVFDFLEMCFVKMLCFFLSRLPLAILKEMDRNDPTEIGEERVRKAIKFLCKLEFLLEDTKIEWSWPDKFVLEDTQAKEDLSLVHQASTTTTVVADPDSGCSQVLPKVGNSEVSLPAAVADTCVVDDDDDDDTIREIGSDEIV